ncbi:hypothetical protein ACFXEL_35160 [Streptomyces sp. NPDC059382]|uniref:hypothetical protein n=1 Tax=Streptomyces sp. NPDC059382 TaxID=3346816 RepID=UPI0036C6CABB
MSGLAALAAHLAYTAPEHRRGCTAGWEVDYRTNTTVRENSHSGHACPIGEGDKSACGHGDEYRALTVRIYCPKCGAATKLEAELPGTPMVYDTARLGMGIKPRRVGQVWIHQGPPPRLGILCDPPGDPQWYLVARHNALRLVAEDIVGVVEPATGPRGGAAYTVSYDLIELSPPAPGGRGTPVFQRHSRLDGRFFPNVTAAARWLAEHSPVPAEGGQAT